MIKGIPKFVINSMVKVKIDKGVGYTERRVKTMTGKVIFVGSHYVTLKCENYKETINFTEILSGSTKILNIMGG